VITIASIPHNVEVLYLSDGGLVRRAPPGAVLIDAVFLVRLSTIEPCAANVSDRIQCCDRVATS
jgi:hypothetical protein